MVVAMNEMRSSNVSGFDHAAPTLRSAEAAVLGVGHDGGPQTPGAARLRPAMEIAVQEAPRSSVAFWSTSPQAGKLISRLVAALSEPASSRRSVLGLLGMACRMVGTDVLLVAAQVARPRWI